MLYKLLKLDKEDFWSLEQHIRSLEVAILEEKCEHVTNFCPQDWRDGLYCSKGSWAKTTTGISVGKDSNG
jgi:hypothetical protein